jgi:hypothetical protein
VVLRDGDDAWWATDGHGRLLPATPLTTPWIEVGFGEGLTWFPRPVAVPDHCPLPFLTDRGDLRHGPHGELVVVSALHVDGSADGTTLQQPAQHVLGLTAASLVWPPTLGPEDDGMPPARSWRDDVSGWAEGFAALPPHTDDHALAVLERAWLDRVLATLNAPSSTPVLIRTLSDAVDAPRGAVNARRALLLFACAAAGLHASGSDDSVRVCLSDGTRLRIDMSAYPRPQVHPLKHAPSRRARRIQFAARHARPMMRPETAD